MTSRRSSGSMRAESAVEPTRSENITVTWRRSARSSGGALGAVDAVAASTEGALPPASVRRAAMASRSFTAMPKRRDAKLLQVLVRQARKNRLVYLILAECRLVLSEAQAPQPTTISMRLPVGASCCRPITSATGAMNEVVTSQCRFMPRLGTRSLAGT